MNVLATKRQPFSKKSHFDNLFIKKNTCDSKFHRQSYSIQKNLPVYITQCLLVFKLSKYLI